MESSDQKRPGAREVLFKDNAARELKPRDVARPDHAPRGATGILLGNTASPSPQVPRPPPPGQRPPSPPINAPRPKPPGLGPGLSTTQGRERPPPPGKGELTPAQKFKRAEDFRIQREHESIEKPRIKR